MRNRRRRSSRRGFALLLVLIIVSFAAAIAVLFLLSAKQERSGTDSYAQGSRVRQLADTAVNIVMGQINTATREGTMTSPVSWASQPGMIRTYKTDGTMSNAYKLYSWPNMIEAGAGFNPNAAAELPPATWYSLPSQYTDLNAPVLTSNGATSVYVYPIVDPAIANTSPKKGQAATVNNTASPQMQWDFPDELSYITDASLGYNANTAAGSNVLPMPVQWLYVLQDGTWLYPSTVTGNVAQFTQTNADGTPVVSTTNPIVGRIAFWTDDETCKVNLNTAGEGSYWDWPKSGSQDEVQFSGNPPAKNEFYRFSGHPASTSLSAIFPEVMGGTAAFPKWNYSGFGPANTTFIAGLKGILGGDSAPSSYTAGLSPRFSFGTGNFTGSQGGTYPAPYYQTYTPASTVSTGTFIDSSTYKPETSYSPVPLQSYRLYATPDEIFFAPAVQSSANTARGGTAPALATYEAASLYNPGLFSGGTATGLSALQLAQRSFLMTVTSKAPETTLFNTPRVSLWPITWPYPSDYYIKPTAASGNYLRGAAPTVASVPSPNTSTLAQLAAYTYAGNHNITPQEDLIAFCSTLNTQAAAPQPYYFQRQNPDSTTSDWTNITRNQYLANYLRGLIHQKEPGFGDSLEDAWNFNNPASAASPAGSVPDWITLQCLDYSRSMINQYTWNPNDSTGKLMYSYTGVAAAQANINGGQISPNERNALSVPPLRISSGLGANFTNNPPPNSASVDGWPAAYVTQGSFPSLKEVAVEFIATQRLAPAYIGTNPAGPIGGIDDPFYWRNLINCGAAYTGTGAGVPGLTQTGPITPNSTGNFDPAHYSTVTNGIPSDTMLTATSLPDGVTGSMGISAHLEASNMYPVGSQTTYMQGIMLFNFAQLRDGINASPSPCFWIKVTGADGFSIDAATSGQGFAHVMKGEYRGRYSVGGSDTVFQTLYGKTFDPTAAPSQMNWPICTPPIALSAGGVGYNSLSFNFAGSKFIVSIYAEYPTTPDTDPTGDQNQFVTSYNVDFSSYTQPLATPIAPRWNVRQAKGVYFPNPQHQVVKTNGATYTPPSYAGTPSTATPYPLPDFAQSGTTSWVATEIVPDIRNINNWGWTGAPIPGTAATADKTYIRDLNNGLSTYPASAGTDNGSMTPLDSLGSSGTQWMMYATIYNNTTETANTNPAALISGTLLSPAVPTGWSMDMKNRVAAISGTVIAAEGTPLPVSGNDQGTNAGPLYTNTSYNSGGGGVPNYGPEAYTEITPYDTVISSIVSPSHADNANLQGDPRLANMTGEKLVFRNASTVIGYQDNSLYPSMVLNGNPPASQFKAGTPGVSTGDALLSGINTVTGFRSFPRPTYQIQQHQLASSCSLSTMTGYQLIPIWSSSQQVPAASRVTTTNPGFALEGPYGGPTGLGSYQNYSGEIGLDTNAWMQMNPDWDWTSCPGNAPDGGFIERPDQDYQSFYLNATTNIGLGTPYFSREGNGSYSSGPSGTTSNVSMFSPNRQVPSPIVLGTLPSSLTQGWQTLAFCPNPSSVIDAAVGTAPNSPAVANPGVLTPNPSVNGAPYTANANGSTIPDHLLLDLFWMPVAEPYPMSEQFSTAGKINLNYTIMPFPYIQRKTGLDAVLKSVMVYAVPDTVSGTAATSKNTPQDYKAWFFMTNAPLAAGTGVGRSFSNTRYPINVPATLNAFDYKFQTAGDLFRSASQICDVFLYPNSTTAANTLVSGLTADSGNSSHNIMTWWNTSGRLTSDNGREAPYNAIYSRITTQSNTYTVHWRVQALHQITADANTTPPQWTEGVDRIVSELRGSTLIERYIDPNAGGTAAAHVANPSIPDNSIPDYANPTVTPAAPITYYYKWRVDNETYFQPGP